jgi:hypothetical protein
MHKKNDFLYTQFEDFFFEEERYFGWIAEFDFGWLHENGPETASLFASSSPLDHVLSCDAL